MECKVNAIYIFLLEYLFYRSFYIVIFISEEIPFLLQRFGLQAKERKKEKILSQISDEDKEDSDSQAENSEEDKPESKKVILH